MILVVDCTGGLSGDRWVAAFLDLGFPLAELKRLLRLCGIPPVRIKRSRVQRDGVWATQVQIPDGSRVLLLPRGPSEWIEWLNASRLPLSLKQSMSRLIRTLAFAEAKVHRQPWNKVAFHQLRGIDTWICFLTFCAGLRFFQIQSVHPSPIPVARRHQDHSGHWKSAVGPATQLLLRRFPTIHRKEPFEFSTPTGAAPLACFGCLLPPDPFRVVRIGHGVGHRGLVRGEDPLRLILGQTPYRNFLDIG